MPALGVHTTCSGELTLPITTEAALPLFTPEGERSWAGDDWDPTYAVEPVGDGARPGTVFTTPSTGGDAIWIVVERTADSLLYARVVPGRIAGTIGVTLSPEETGCRVRVTYEITSLGTDGESWIREFEHGYEDFLEHWRHAILASLSSE